MNTKPLQELKIRDDGKHEATMKTKQNKKPLKMRKMW